MESSPLPQSIDLGATSNFTCRVLNTGKDTATVSELSYYLSSDSISSFNDVLLGTIPINALAGNSSVNLSGDFTITPNVTAGNYYIIYAIDGENQNMETNENNNITFSKIVTTKPLAVEDEPIYSTSFNIFPNPNAGEFKFEMDKIIKAEKVHCILYNTLGLKVDERDLIVKSGYAETFYKVTSAKGVYVIEIELNKKKTFMKVLVQ
jgi:hypothetical protein